MNRMHGTWAARTLGIWVAATALAVSVTGVPAVVQAQTATSAPDLAAMVLTPSDVERAGLPAHGWSNGILTTDPASVAGFFSFWRSEAEVTSMAAALSAAAPTRLHALNLVRPTSEGDASLVDERVVSYVMSFADEASAAAGFSVWSAMWQSAYTSSPTKALVGHDRALVAGRASEPDGSPFPIVHLTFRVGALVGGVSVELFTGFSPEQIVAEQLATRQHELMLAALSGEAPELSSRVVQLELPGEQAITAVYAIRNGQRLFRDSDTSASAAESQATTAASGIIDQFQVEQQVAGDPGGATAPVTFYTNRIVTFATPDAASAYITDSVARLSEGGATDIVALPPPAAGEQVESHTYRHVRGDGLELNDYRVYARSGTTVFSIGLNTTGPVDVAAMDLLATMQAACLAGTESCEAPVPVPPALAG